MISSQKSKNKGYFRSRLPRNFQVPTYLFASGFQSASLDAYVTSLNKQTNFVFFIKKKKTSVQNKRRIVSIQIQPRLTTIVQPGPGLKNFGSCYSSLLTAHTHPTNKQNKLPCHKGKTVIPHSHPQPQQRNQTANQKPFFSSSPIPHSDPIKP